jgi:butyrate kinase
MTKNCEDYILAINPGSTSTKIAVYLGQKPQYQKNIIHNEDELSVFDKITDQIEFRRDKILKELEHNDIEIECLKIIMGRGGLVKPVPSGVIEVNEALLNDLKNSPLGEHASNLGGILANDIAKRTPSAKAYIVDPVVVDEYTDVARIAGHPNFERQSIFHALNQKSVARQYAASIGSKYEDLNLIVVHMGGGITIGAHQKGKVIDANQGLDGSGPFTPNRSGNLPIGQVIKAAFSGKYTEAEMRKMVNGNGGLKAYLGTMDGIDIEKRISSGDKKAELVYNAMAYQIGKYVGSMVAVLHGQLDAIIITGGLAYSNYLVSKITQMTSSFGKIHVSPGEDEMKALAINGLRVLNNETKPLIYK